MRLVRSLVVLALVAAGAAHADPIPLTRLPGWAVPQSYQLTFKIDPHQQRFTGHTVIRVKLDRASDHLWLHGHDLAVDQVTVTDAHGHAKPATWIEVAPQQGVARIDFGRTLKPGQIVLGIDYSAPFNRQLQGLYKVSDDGQPYAMTQMEPISARYAFPSFDEPGFKTPYDIALTVPDGEVAVANTAQLKEVGAGPGWKTVSFAPTKPLPTYLVAFAVGPWDVVPGPTISPDAVRAEPVPLRGIAPQGQGRRMQHVLGETPAIIHALESYYGFGYPFGKLDLLAAPDFAAGAMENAGLVTFRDWLLLLDPDSPARYVRGSFEVTAHELAHQWTGDTVTLAWWNDIWLNEAFATWMQQKVTEQLHPEYRADLDRIEGAQRAMANDSLASARAIRQPITGNGDIETAFDGITYQKGAAVIGMFEHYVGADAFRQGMRAYIQAHKFGNADATDLVAAIATAAHRGAAFRHAFMSFLDQSGVPLISTALAQANGQTVLQLSQSRYLPLGSSADPNRQWGIPVCVRYGVDGGSRVACRMLDTAHAILPLPGASASSWVMPNANASGYYRFGLDRAALAVLSKQVGHLADTEQLAYADAVGASFRRGDLDAGDVLAAFEPLTGATTTAVALAPLPTVEWLYDHEAITDAQRRQLADWVQRNYLPRLQQLGYRRRPGESDQDTQLRVALANALALDFRIEAVRAPLLKQGDAALKSGPDGKLDLAAADPDLLGTALAVVVRERGEPAVHALIAAVPQTTDPALRNAMLEGLSYAEGPLLSDEVRNFALQPAVKVGEMAMLLHGGHDTPAKRDATWQWATAHYAQLVARSGSFSTGALPALFAGGGCSRAEADRLSAFFTPRLGQLTGAARGLAQTRESILLCAALKAKQDPAAILR